MEFPISYKPEGVARSDTLSIDVPKRILGMDAPEIHFSGTNENNKPPKKYRTALHTQQARA